MRQDPDPATTSERDSLSQYLDYQRETILLKTEGLTREQLTREIPSSGLTLAGLLYHLALVEESWFEVEFRGLKPRDDFAGVDWDADPDYEFRTATDRDPDWLRHRYQEACDRARQVVADADSMDALSVSARIGGKPFTLRWAIMHLIEETARHAGHADLLREAVDGSVGEWRPPDITLALCNIRGPNGHQEPSSSAPGRWAWSLVAASPPCGSWPSSWRRARGAARAGASRRLSSSVSSCSSPRAPGPLSPGGGASSRWAGTRSSAAEARATRRR